ncbi:PAS domain S-box protein [Aliifodinibius sp. S!AR15-10]|uniref:PAS domain S-box protein n=1 Tax=Aliifodinibius sp. S!AR15-10 TaxID=2950437 RepID=UPI00286389E4|nr:PAS domain S-box protein [Aliifodinibius sp. S!AR15-10]MDR8391751.1 PAS domain S-box protein [Aliifodinibius sp. S!AR15-10]
MENEHLLFKRNPIPMLVYDLDSLNILDANTAAIEQYGYSAEEFQQMTLEDIHTSESVKKLHQVLNNLDSGINKSRIIQHKEKSGDIFYVQVMSHFYPYESYNSRLVAVMDISEEVDARLEAEQAYRELDLVKENPLAMITWDSKLRVTEWSRKAEEISGYRREDMLGKSLFKLDLFPSDIKEFLNGGFEGITTEGTSGQLETVIQNKDGRIIDIRIHTSVLQDKGGRPQTLLTFVEDITETKRVERRLWRQNEMIHFVNNLSYSVGNLDNYDEALQVAIGKICDFIGWPVGHVYKRGTENKFESSDIWHLEHPDRYPTIIERSRKTDFVLGKGFLGEVLRQGRPLWMKDIDTRKGFMRNAFDLDLNVKTCFAFPVKARGELSVLIEFFNDESLPEVPQVLELAETISSQLGPILERICAREELELSERKYRRLFERATDGIVILEGREIIDCNGKMEEIFECLHEDIIGETPFTFSPETQPSGHSSSTRGQQLIRKVLNGTPQHFEWKHLTKKGKLIDTEVTLNKLVLEDGIYIQGIVRDITKQKKAEKALKRSEELFRNLFLRAPVAMLMVDEKNKVQMVNSNFEDLFGYSENEIKFKDIDPFIVPEGEYETAPKMPGKEFLNKDFIKEFTRITKDGQKIDVLLGAIPVYLDGQPLAGFGIYIDISDQKNIQRKLENSLKEKEILLKEIHHRVKNNLAVISALLELQAFNEQEDKLSGLLGDSLLRIKTMALVHETLYKTENFAHLQLSSYIEKLIGFNNEAMATTEKDIKIDLNIQDINLNINQAIPCALILNEFVSNAFKYAFEGRKSGELMVRIWRDEETVHVIVKDDGVGLPDNFEELRKVYMGMTLIDQLTKQVNGELNIHNNDGTTFELIFEKENASGSSSHYFK